LEERRGWKRTQGGWVDGSEDVEAREADFLSFTVTELRRQQSLVLAAIGTEDLTTSSAVMLRKECQGKLKRG
jgi:hypothetical protein